MKTVTIDSSEIQSPGFIVPPECQGQAVEYSYACTEDYIIERRADPQNGSWTYIAHRWPVDSHTFDPQNGTPQLGQRVGLVTFQP